MKIGIFAAVIWICERMQIFLLFLSSVYFILIRSLSLFPLFLFLSPYTRIELSYEYRTKSGMKLHAKHTI